MYVWETERRTLGAPWEAHRPLQEAHFTHHCSHTHTDDGPMTPFFFRFFAARGRADDSAAGVATVGAAVAGEATTVGAGEVEATSAGAAAVAGAAAAVATAQVRAR